MSNIANLQELMQHVVELHHFGGIKAIGVTIIDNNGNSQNLIHTDVKSSLALLGATAILQNLILTSMNKGPLPPIGDDGK